MSTPMLQQYYEIKAKVPDAILFFRLGDFYEMFGQDAEVAAPVLEIVLTARDAGKGSKIPMCGVPFHAADSYLTKLVSAGYKVAICEQIEDAHASKGIVKRDIVRIVTPGTMDTISSETKNNYLACITKEKDWGLAYADITTGDFKIFQTPSLHTLLAELNRIEPAELLISQEMMAGAKLFADFYLTSYDKSWFKNKDLLLDKFQDQKDMLDRMPLAAKAAAALWYYIKTNIPNSGQDHIIHISFSSAQNTMILDKWTRKNLELVDTLRDNDLKGTLLSILNLTRTAFGGRLLRNWILQPLVDETAIKERLDRVEELVQNTFLRKDLQKWLNQVYDLERLLGKLSYGKANARDMLAMAQTLSCLEAVRQIISDNKSLKLKRYLDPLTGLDELAHKLTAAIDPESPVGLKEGNLIRSGYCPEIDELRTISTGGREWIARLENQERERTRIRSLKISYNKVFGYYIEITNANAHLVPEDYQRKQTLVNAERYITPELKDYEQKILSAQGKLNQLEYEIFSELRDELLAVSPKIMEASQALAEIDVFVSLAEAAAQNNYVRPEIRHDGSLNIVEGRHPVVEYLLEDQSFVPNDTHLTSTKHLAVITGPNMAGKSTYLRQVALIVLMAQIGCFVPARKADISLVDRIFTRVGASDNLASGQSTFMVEMTEVAHILSNATTNSLLILDEVGRGTATFDGLSLAWAITEFLVENPALKAKTLFATHYHELTQLEELYPEVFNLHVAVREQEEDIIFLHRILPGNVDKSYGLYVAKIAGLPSPILQRAAVILGELESSSTERNLKDIKKELSQPSLFPTTKNHPLLEELAKLDVDSMTPRQALEYLYDLTYRVHSSQVI